MGQIDLDAKVWTIAATRMKAGTKHRVLLSKAAFATLGEIRDDDKLIFDSVAKPGKLISDMSITAVLRHMERSDIAEHGSRSTFLDWADETKGFPRELSKQRKGSGVAGINSCYVRK